MDLWSISNYLLYIVWSSFCSLPYYPVAPVSFVDFPSPLNCTASLMETAFLLVLLLSPLFRSNELFFSPYTNTTLVDCNTFLGSESHTHKHICMPVKLNIYMLYIYKDFLLLTWINSRDIMYNIMIIVNDTVLYIWKSLKDLKISQHT